MQQNPIKIISYSQMKLRSTLGAILMNSARDLRTQADAVQLALQERIETMDTVRVKLEIDLKEVSCRVCLCV